MITRQGWSRQAAVRMMLGLAASIALVGAVLSTPSAIATPESDAQDAISAAWEAAGGESSQLGSPHGGAYPVGAGFAQDFARGKMFYSTPTGARAVFGAILEKYDSWGGPADSDLGFPTISEVVGLVSPDSRMVTFSAPDHPLIFWTPEHGAYVVRGAMNAAWDRLGSSTGPLGVPVADETQDGAVISQKFSGGALAWNSQTKVFTSQPPDLATQLGDLNVDIDPTVAINRAWHAAGGAAGPLGIKQGDQFQVGTDGVGQGYAGGKIYFSPATGAFAVENDILAKFESLGGPAGSDLGFPLANETDGGIPNSRMVTFSAADAPVIFYTSDNGAFVVRGAIKIAWDKLDAATGKLGAPVGDQSVEGDVVSQRFAGGQVFWNRASNTFSTDPSGLAKSLAGLEIPGATSNPSSASTDHGPSWHWWWLGVALGALAILGTLLWALRGRRRRRSRRSAPSARMRRRAEIPVEPDEDIELDEQWAPRHEADTTGRIPGRYDEGRSGPPSGVDLLGGHRGWESGGPPSGVDLLGGHRGWESGGPPSGVDLLGGHRGWTGPEPRAERVPEGGYRDGEDQDRVDTAPTRVPTEAELGGGRHAAVDHLEGEPEAGRPETPPQQAPHPRPERFESLGPTRRDDGYEPPVEHRGSGLPGVRPVESSGYPVESSGHPAMHLPLDDPYQPPAGYPVKANFSSGLYYTVDSALYDDTLAEVWFVSEQAAERNGFVRAR